MELVVWALPHLALAELAMVRRSASRLRVDAEHAACVRWRVLDWTGALEEAAIVGRGKPPGWWRAEVACAMPGPVWRRCLALDLMPKSVDLIYGVQELAEAEDVFDEALPRLTPRTVQFMGEYLVKSLTQMHPMHPQKLLRQIVRLIRVCDAARFWHSLHASHRTWVLLDALMAGVCVLKFVRVHHGRRVFPLEDALREKLYAPSCVVREIAMACKPFPDCLAGLTPDMLDRIADCCPEFFSQTYF